MSSALALISCNATFQEGRRGEGKREAQKDVWRMTEMEEEEAMEQSREAWEKKRGRRV